MKQWAIIATWRMAIEGVSVGANLLKNGGNCQDAVEKAVMEVEDYPYYKSVGYGGLPNEDGEVELDAAFMDGKTLAIGAVASVRNIKNPVSVARKLSTDRVNIFLSAAGAEAYADKYGFPRQNMLTERAKKAWELRLQQIHQQHLSPYSGHDTVCVIGLDANCNMAVATSTSGLFMKKAGRIGDSPLSGSGFYADNDAGCAAATGLGEDIMKGCLSYDVVQKMKTGMTPTQAAQTSVRQFSAQLKKRQGGAGAMSIIAMNNQGEWGIGTNVEFSFALADNEHAPAVYLARPDTTGNEINITLASAEYMAEYRRTIQKPI